MVVPVSYWTNYPPPYYQGGWAPVPGWGVRPVMAGPARVGVGQFKLKAPEVTDCMRRVLAELRAHPEVNRMVAGGAWRTSGVSPDLTPASCGTPSGQQRSRDAWAAYKAGQIDAFGRPIVEAAPPFEEAPPARPFPWMYLLAGAFALGGGAAFAYNRGWLGGRRR